ncbi:acyl-CoA:lysophosphatidylglycerol acyltransferase 1 isoform X1 [Frankliniella occidentalis]|uniref:Acyl-CoA:lysophosphatidylglycerol acyltransferase 1 isoform X1 n=1 Tax=Frankliniella occidentalis TaxID=133901 RepID=A0A6J1S7D8_FRAOC|nr:acyl-CoA:lysophosphatidylglycerol acyltransferase 1 isoform X1 [Frankliniella occidentalis]XP_026276937.1 acyl-CoA:lysophosphatidylglycerol acyltransferase 1 isoform X1 [Frankliniella occidentalis]
MEQSRLTVWVKGFLRLCFVLVNNAYTIPTYVIWMLLLTPLRFLHPELFWRIEGLFFHWLLAMVSMWSWSAGYDVVELGDDYRLCLHSPALIIANHQSTADVPMLMAAYNAKPNILPNIMWIMDRAFKFTNFGIVSIMHQDFFIQIRRGKRDECLKELRDHLHNSFSALGRHWMILFPEGGFLRKRRETSQRYALKNNLPVLEHVSLPRTGAMEAIVEELAVPYQPSSKISHVSQSSLHSGMNIILYYKIMHHLSTVFLYYHVFTIKFYFLGPKLINWVLDLTIAYPEGKPLDLPTIITGWREPCKTYLFYRVFNMADIPREQEGLTKWLFDRWVEKEEMLKHYYETGKFPVEKFSSHPMPTQVISQDALRFVILHIFFLVSSYVHYRMFSFVYQFW